MIITLTGMMGCGKSSVGRELSGLLSLPFIDLDEYIETREGRSIRDIFESEGEEAFRKMELEALKEILAQAAASEPGQAAASEPGYTMSHETAAGTDNASPSTDPPQAKDIVLSLGGGTLTTPECAELVSARTFCIYLKASPATLLAHLEHESAGRPMLKNNAATSDTAHQNAPVGSSDGTTPISSEAPNRQLHRRITTLLSQRAPAYEATSRLTISTDGLSISQIAAAISKLPDK